MQRPHQRFSDRIAKAMERHRAEGPQQPSRLGNEEYFPLTPPAGLIVVPSELGPTEHGEATELPLTGAIVSVDAQPASYPATAIVELRQRRARRRLLFVFFCLLLIGLAFVPVSDDLVLPASVVAYGEEAVVVSPASGIVKQTLVGAGERVKRGDRLLLIEPPTSMALIAERRNWNELKIREARLLARIAGEERFSRPGGLFILDVGPDIDSMMLEQQRLLTQGWREDRATLEPLEESIERLERDGADARATLAATEKQLANTEARHRKAGALRDRNIVYEDGVYTIQLAGTLEQMARSLRGQLAKREQALAKADGDLQAARKELAQQKQQRARALEARLALTRGELASSSARLATLAGQQSLIEVRSAWTGTVRQLTISPDDGQVQSGEELMTLHVPGEQAILEALIPSYDRERIRVGQPATVTFPHPGNERPVEYAGVVRSLAPSQGQLAYVQVEINTLRQGGGAAHELVAGLRGEVLLASREEALRQHLWRWLRRQVESFDAQALVGAFRALVERGWTAISLLQHSTSGGHEQGP